MTLEQWANVGELVGGIAVVASLIYLAIQIRQNTATVKSATLAQNTDIWQGMLLEIAKPEFSQAYLKGAAGKPDLSAEELRQFYYICRILFVAFENQFYQYSHETLDRDTYLGYERTIKKQLLSAPGFQIYWQLCRQEFSPQFMQRVDDLIREMPQADPMTLAAAWQQQAAKFAESD